MPYKDADKQKACVRKSQQEARAKFMADGLCCCGKPCVEGKRQCKQCVARRPDYTKRQREIRKAEGRCYACGQPANGETRCERCRIKSLENDRKIRSEVLTAYGSVCQCCGETEDAFLCIDHINGGGSKHRREIGGRIYNWLRRNKFPKGFQVLCHNCNHAKHLRGTCPHGLLAVHKG